METVDTGNHDQDSSELKVHMTRINELVANMIKQEIYLKEELATKKEDLASFTASLENSNKEIAEKLYISVKTVEAHKSKIMEKLQLKGRPELVEYALRKKFLNF